MSVRELFTFPNPVNEKAARSVAGGVVVLALLTLITQWWWLAALLALGFALRVAGGPRYSPLGRLAVHVIAPRFGAARLVPGPPKRFAQTVGLVFSGVAAIAALGFGATTLCLGPARRPRRLRTARVRTWVLRRLLGLRSPHAPRRHPRGDLRGLQRHPPPSEGSPTRLTSTQLQRRLMPNRSRASDVDIGGRCIVVASSAARATSSEFC